MVTATAAAQQLSDQFDEIDKQFEYDQADQSEQFQGDHIQMHVNPREEGEFPSEDDREEGEDSSDYESDAESTDSVKIRKLTSEEEFQQDLVALKANPAFNTYIKGIVANEIAEERKTKKNSAVNGKKDGISSNSMGKMKTVKSPSNMTLYAPALRQITEPNLVLPSDLNLANKQNEFVQMVENNISDGNTDHEISVSSSQVKSNDNKVNDMDSLTNQIIHFIEGIRVKSRDDGHGSGSGRRSYNAEEDQLRAKVSQYVEAECNAPPGKIPINNVNTMEGLDEDDQFFHVTCHIDDTLQPKIQHREYVDVDKLLPKVQARNDNKLDLVYKDGHSYFIPAPSESKINGMR